MHHMLNETHDPSLRSWVESANAQDTDFPIQNLPYGVFRRASTDEPMRVGVAIGDSVLDVGAALDAGAFDGAAAEAADACRAPSLNALMGLGPDRWTALRAELSAFVNADSLPYRRSRAAIERVLVPMADAEMALPVEVGDYSDFYASIHHATNVGALLRPDSPLLPNYRWVPIGYHGRASSLMLSGAAVRRPRGQLKPDGAADPVYAPIRRMDYELELGFYIGVGNALGEPVPIDRARSRVFGVSLLNDWSARDVQRWEYQPLGPFLAKSFATSLSPWVVTLEALAPFAAPAPERPPGDPAPLAYLSSPDDAAGGAIDLTLEVYLSSRAMRDGHIAPVLLSRGSYRDMYWTVAQLVAHHTSNGCNLRTGDLLGSGTVSGQTRDACGSLIELTFGGAQPLALPTGEHRGFLEDGDQVTLYGYADRDGFRRIGLGQCAGEILGADAPHD